jgi:beta-glucosidase
MTLLKNENDTLPLRKDLRSIAVIGPTAKDGIPLGGYSGFNIPTVSVLDGIKKIVGPNTKVEWTRGSSFQLGHSLPPISGSVLRDIKGEYFDNEELQGEPKLVRNDTEIAFNWDNAAPDAKLPREHFSVRWTGTIVPEKTGDYTIGVTSDDGSRLWLNGKKVIDDWTVHPSKLNTIAFHVEAGVPIAFRLEYFQQAGQASCELGWSLADSTSPDIDAAVALAQRSDVAVIVAGIIEGEGQDRAYLDLPGNQEELIQRVAATGKPVVVVLVAGSPVTMQNWVGKVPAILDAWYPGQEGGTAIAEALFGDVNPGGKLPMTFPLSVGQCPVYYNLEPSGRGYDYVDLTGKPLFPFGFGLSYTKFGYSNLKISPEAAGKSESVTVTFDVQNTGSVKGDEVPQLYLHQAVSSIVRPLKELEGFQRISLAPGEIKTVSFTLNPDQMAIWDEHMKRVIERGKFEIMIGSSSDDIRLRGAFTER